MNARFRTPREPLRTGQLLVGFSLRSVAENPRDSIAFLRKKEWLELVGLFCPSFEAKRRILFCPLNRNIDAAAERLTRKIWGMTTLGDGLDNRR